MKNIFYAILAWVWSAVICAESNDTIKPLYPCSDLLERAYGVCSHITRPHVDYERRDEQLKLMREAGMSMVRSDLDFYNFMNDESISHTSIFNNVISSCRKSDVGLLGILTNPNRYAWGNAPLYEKYLRALARQYNGQIDYWEVFNEVNLFRGVDKLPQRYAEALQTTYKVLKSENPDNKVVLTGMAEVHNSFLDDICKEGAHKYFDIMNFHSYLEPEQLIPSFHKIREVMDRYGWHKPVWLTECGMHTAQDDNPYEGFYTDLLPAALKRIGIDERKICIGYLRDVEKGYTTLSDDDAEYYFTSRCKSHRTVSLDELKSLPVKKVPVLVATSSEYFPGKYLPDLVDYVRRGGTIILPYGCPLYYDCYSFDGRYDNKDTRGHKDLPLLHMAAYDIWGEQHKGGLTEVPTAWQRTGEADFSYEWKFTANSPARYLTADNLAPGDSLIPLITAGRPDYQHAVAGIYKLNSDLKGNVIFHTRMYCSTKPNLETEQARRVARIYLLAWAHGVNKVFWYNLCASENDKTEKEDNFGLLHRDLSPKPSYMAYQTLTRFCPDGSTRPVLVRHNDIYQARWTRPDGSRIYAAWCSSGRREIRHDLSTKAKWYDYLGREIKVGKSLTLTTSVVYGVENANQHWKNVKVESTIEGVQPMTGLVLWPAQAKSLHQTYGNSIQLEFAYCLPSKVVKGCREDGSIEYDWSWFENILDDVASRNHQLVARFRYEYPSSREVDGKTRGMTAVPDFIRRQAGYEETYNDVKGDGPTWYADWRNDALMRFTKQFYADFADRYRHDPRLAFLEVGFGHWSEYHIFGTQLNLGRNFPSKSFQREFFLHLDSVMTGLPWLVSIDAGDARYAPFPGDEALGKIHFGLFDDSFMHKGHELASGSGFNERMWQSIDGGRRWKEGVCGGEVSYYTQREQREFLRKDGLYGHTWEEQSSKYHLSFIIANDAPRGEYGTAERFKEAGMAVGYRFAIKDVRTNGHETRLTIANHGTAPLYRDAWVSIRGTRSQTTLRGLLPGETKEIVIPCTIKDGKDIEIVSDAILKGQHIGFTTSD